MILTITLLGWDIPILLVKKLSFREVVDFPVKGHLTIKWVFWDSTPGLSAILKLFSLFCTVS